MKYLSVMAGVLVLLANVAVSCGSPKENPGTESIDDNHRSDSLINAAAGEPRILDTTKSRDTSLIKQGDSVRSPR